jgi:uracil-DNA glycosylase
LADAREQLRRYLEQRREMGESELVLDSLTVEDALKLLGAKPAARSSAADEPRAHTIIHAPRQEADPLAERAPEPQRGGAALEGSAGDWREALRATGAAPEDAMKKKVGRLEFPAGDSAAATPSTSPVPPLAPAPTGLSSSTASSDVLGGMVAELSSLDQVAAHVATCTRCPLYSTATNPVPGEGNPQADLMCVGEAPGATEDETGRPFVGAAGQLLTKILEAIQLSREQVYIANVLKHRPPGNRNPLPEEVTACSPYLIRQIELVKPKVIIALGTFAAQTLLGSQLSLGKLRGQIHRFHGVPLIVTYHPAALLRNPSWKRPTWEDVQLARRILDSAQPGA